MLKASRDLRKLIFIKKISDVNRLVRKVSTNMCLLLITLTHLDDGDLINRGNTIANNFKVLDCNIPTDLKLNAFTAVSDETSFNETRNTALSTAKNIVSQIEDILKEHKDFCYCKILEILKGNIEQLISKLSAMNYSGSSSSDESAGSGTIAMEQVPEIKEGNEMVVNPKYQNNPEEPKENLALLFPNPPERAMLPDFYPKPEEYLDDKPDDNLDGAPRSKKAKVTIVNRKEKEKP